jgi:hypothetical protein
MRVDNSSASGNLTLHRNLGFLGKVGLLVLDGALKLALLYFRIWHLFVLNFETLRRRNERSKTRSEVAASRLSLASLSHSVSRTLLAASR